MNLSLFNLPYMSSSKLLAGDFSGVILATSPEAETDDHPLKMKKGDAVCGVLPDFLGNTSSPTEVAHFDVGKACTIRKPAHLTHVQAASLPLVSLTAHTSMSRIQKEMTSSPPSLHPSLPPSANNLVVLGGWSATGIYTIKLVAKSRRWTVLSRRRVRVGM